MIRPDWVRDERHSLNAVDDSMYRVMDSSNQNSN